jgi:hypothetical protein
MCKCGLDYQMDTLHNAYSNKHLEPIECTRDVRILNCNLKRKILNHLKFWMTTQCSQNQFNKKYKHLPIYIFSLE